MHIAQEKIFMVAHKAYHFGLVLFEIENKFDNTVGIRPPVYIVSEKNDRVLFVIDVDEGHKLCQLPQTAVDIANDENLSHFIN